MYLKINYKKFRSAFLTGIACIGICGTLQAQTLEEGRQLINNGDYPAAVTAFETLIKKYGSRADVNKWYGEALFKTGDYEKAEKYLTIAAKRRVVGAYLYLGELQVLNYQFTEAIANYKKYQATLKKNPEESARIDSLIDQAELNIKAMNRVEEVAFIDSIIVDKHKFFQYYKLSQESGRLLDYQMLMNADPSEKSVVFESQRGDQRVFGKKTEENGYDLFHSSKLVGNNWSEPVAFPATINTAANENFPFVLTDGTTIYFASDQAPTLGGYDLYVTKYNSANGSYFTPERLAMPFNSPYNDYLLAIDEGNQVGWFATDRFQPADKVIIYLFIPVIGQKKYYRDISEEQARDYAKITSIKATWPENNDYEKLLYQIYHTETDLSQQKGAFLFVINDKILYYNLTDFESNEARKIYEQVLDIKKLQKQDAEKLNQLRSQWAKGNQATQHKIKASILQLENKVIELGNKIDSLEIESRNKEINFLRSRR